VLSRHLVPVVVVVVVLMVVLLSWSLGRWCSLLHRWLLVPTIHPASSGSQGWGWLGCPSSLWGAGKGAGLFLVEVLGFVVVGWLSVVMVGHGVWGRRFNMFMT
jgi:hypothetical protein